MQDVRESGTDSQLAESAHLVVITTLVHIYLLLPEKRGLVIRNMTLKLRDSRYPARRGEIKWHYGADCCVVLSLCAVMYIHIFTPC